MLSSLKAIVALLFLNSALSFTNWWPTPAIKFDARLAPEMVGLWVLLLLWIVYKGSLGRLTLSILSLAYLALIVGRYGEVTVPALFGRPINLYWDGHQIPIVLSVLARQVPWWVPVVIVVAVASLLYGLYRMVRWAIAVTAKVSVPVALRSPTALLVTAFAVVLVSLNLAGIQATWPWVSKPVIPTYARQVKLLSLAALPESQAAALPQSPRFDGNLRVLAGVDVGLFFLESYGAMVYDNPTLKQSLRESREKLEQAIAASGQTVVSGLVRSPTFGGGSELAHLGLLSGLELSDPFRHDLLLTTRRPTLISHFCQHGYQTFGLYASLSWDWPEKSFYGFDVFVDGRDLNYRGPKFGAWWIPDQYAIARFEQMHPATKQSPPRFILFPTIMSHIPFAQIPPYQSDWAKLLVEQPYADAASERSLAQKTDWLNLLPDYRRAMAYTFDWLAGYVAQARAREQVLILLGDHQPASNVSGPGASWDVPVHIVSANPALIKRLTAAGFSPGLEPRRPALGAMHELTQTLLNVFDDRFCYEGDGCARK